MKGIKLSGCTLYKGIPYAKAGRFEKPVLAEPDFEGDYTSWPKAAWQKFEEPGSFYDREFYDDTPHPKMSEDCLYLNIWVPDQADQADAAIWIHGGAFDHGWSYEKEFDGEIFARNGIILVTIQYRAGVLGFFHLEGMEANLGIQDQLTALKWVYENISFFGGSPKKITVFGQSAGCMSVMALLSNNQARSMIKGAILQSGLGLDSSSTIQKQTELSKQFLSFARFNIETLLHMEPQKIIDLQSRFLNIYPLAFAPSIDGGIILQRFEEADLKDIPILFGSTYNDIFTNPKDLKKGNRGMIYEGCLYFGNRMIERNHRVWMYDFIRALPGDDAGAFHSSELWYIFNTLKQAWRPWQKADYDLARRIQKAWMNFIRFQDPGWEPFPHIEVFDV